MGEPEEIELEDIEAIDSRHEQFLQEAKIREHINKELYCCQKDSIPHSASKIIGHKDLGLATVEKLHRQHVLSLTILNLHEMRRSDQMSNGGMTKKSN